MQSVHDEHKEDKKQMEELHKLRENHKKQLAFLTDTRQELEKQKAEILAEYNSLKNGTTVRTDE